MAIENGYATLEDLRARLDIESVDTDLILEQVIESASRQIDGWCGRSFFTVDEARQLTADNAHMAVLPEDLHEVTEIATDRDDDGVYETIWPATAYSLQPYPGPFQVIRPRGSNSFPCHAYALRIEGKWGYGATVPATIRLQAARLYKRMDAPFGIAGTADHGQLQTISRIDPDIQELIKPFIRHWMVV